MSFGASSVVAPLTPVSDLAVVPVMDRLHRRLVAGTDAATALATARTTAMSSIRRRQPSSSSVRERLATASRSTPAGEDTENFP